MNQIVAGMVVMGYFVGGLFFWRYWTRTKDMLFVYFAVAFWILSVQRLSLALYSGADTETAPFYVLRLCAFLLIIVAIWKKNRS